MRAATLSIDVPTKRGQAAARFFREHMLQPCKEKSVRYQQYGFEGNALPSDRDWIVLAALVTGDRPAGSDSLSELERHHVRSHRFGTGPTYTVVQEYARVEFDALKSRSHLAVSYATDLSSVEIRRFKGEQWLEYVQEFGGFEFFAFSRFTDPEITIDPGWMLEHSQLLLTLDAGRIVCLNPVIGQR